MIRPSDAITLQSYEFSFPGGLMFITLLQILLILDSFVLVAAILLQAGKGSGMAASFGGVSSSPDAFIGTRQAGTWLTKITWWTGGLFIGIAFVLQVGSVRSRAPKSVLEQGLAPAPAAPAPSAPATTAPALPFVPGQTAPAPATPGTASPSGTNKAPATAATPPASKPAAPATPSPTHK